MSSFGSKALESFEIKANVCGKIAREDAAYV